MELISRTADRINFHFRDTPARPRYLFRAAKFAKLDLVPDSLSLLGPDERDGRKRLRRRRRDERRVAASYLPHIL